MTSSPDAPPCREAHPSTVEAPVLDVAVIGAGAVGCALARELSYEQLNVAVFEAEPDVGCGTSKANSGIVHAGFDAAPGSLMARLNVAGAALMPQLCRDLDIPYEQNGSLVLAFDRADIPRLEELASRGCSNGVEGLEVIGQERLRRLEPHVSPEAVAALWAPTAGIVDPFMLCVAQAELAADNGVWFHLSEPVGQVHRLNAQDEVSSQEAAALSQGARWCVATARGAYYCRCVAAAAGLFSADLYNPWVPQEQRLSITPRRGSYYLLDISAEPAPCHTLFQLPGPKGKGVLVAPTVHGNTLVGPTAVDVDDPEATCTSAAELAAIAQLAHQSFPKLDLKATITSFAGLRAHEAGHEFVVREVAPGYVHAAGIESPGLTASPAIALMMKELLGNQLHYIANKQAGRTRKGPVKTRELSVEQLALLVESDPAYGEIICRCEQISAGEILDACSRSIPVITTDGVKRRVRAGMGRCQGGFCLPRVLELVAQAALLPQEAIGKNSSEAPWITGPVKEGL